MTQKKSILSGLIILTLIICSGTKIHCQNVDLTNLKGPYLGQKPPGKTPELFAPDIISTNAFEFSITFSNDGYEVYFSRRLSRNAKSQIYGYKYESDQWVLKNPPLFDWDGSDAKPNFSPDGKRIYFGSARPLSVDPKGNRYPEWYVENKGNKWSEAKLVGSPVLETGTMFMTQTNSGFIYFTGFNPKMGIYSSKIDGDEFKSPTFLPEVINNYLNPGHPYIAPDESYMIYDFNTVSPNRNLLISYRTGDSWTKPVNLTEYLGITTSNSNVPFVTFDGKYFFFAADNDIYWVDTSFIEDLRPKN